MCTLNFFHHWFGHASHLHFLEFHSPPAAWLPHCTPGIIQKSVRFHTSYAELLEMAWGIDLPIFFGGWKSEGFAMFFFEMAQEVLVTEWHGCMTILVNPKHPLV